MEAQILRRGREAVSSLIGASDGEEPGDGHLAQAVGAVLLASAAALMDEAGPDTLQDLLEAGNDGAKGNKLCSALSDWAAREPMVAEGPFARGLKLLSGKGSAREVAGSLLSLMRLVAETRKKDGEWPALRLLGALYEDSLSWRLTEGGLGRSSRRIKAQGAVYTPQPVARFLTVRTLSPLVSSARDLHGLSSITVCDPAFGAGAFLLEAMRYLEEEALRRGWLGEGREERLRLRKTLASTCLHGVDLDEGAVHLTRLVLWIASGGGEGAAKALARSIRHGDTLIGAWRDDVEGSTSSTSDPPDLREALDGWCLERLPSDIEASPFHWEVEFPGRFPSGGRGAGGFDALIGNPPYVGSKALGHLGPYLKERYPESYTGYNDLSAFFFHRGLELLRPGGRLGFIAPAYWFQNTYGEKLRGHVLSQARLEEVFDFGAAQVFRGRGVHTAVVVLEKTSKSDEAGAQKVLYKRLDPEELKSSNGDVSRGALRVAQSSLGASRWVFASAEVESILRKAFQTGVPLGELFFIEKGPTTGCNGVFTMDGDELINHGIEEGLLRRCIKNGEIRRYGPLRPSKRLLYLDGSVDVGLYPKALAYLEAHRRRLSERNEVRRGLYPWWRLERPRRRALFEAGAKLVVPYRAGENRFTLDEAGCFNDGGDVRVLVPQREVGRTRMLAALAVANSKAGELVYRYMGKPKGRILEYFVKPLAQAPYAPAEAEWTWDEEEALKRCLAEEGPEAMVERVFRKRGTRALITPALALLAERMLDLHKDGEERAATASTDEAIDRLVAKLFGLSRAEEALAGREVAEGRRA